MPVIVHRLLVYEFPDKDTAFKHLVNRGVKGLQIWGNCSITEHFYKAVGPAGEVIKALLPPPKKGEPPSGY